MASKRNVIKAPKSPMGSATCYTTNMTRCVIRPTYKGGATYLPGLQGERRLWARWRVIETHREEEVRYGKTVQPQSEIMDLDQSEVTGCCATGVTPHASSRSSTVSFHSKHCNLPKICASQVETVYCVLLYEVTGLQGKRKYSICYWLWLSLQGEEHISLGTSLYTFNYPAQQAFFILLWAQWFRSDKDYNWIKSRWYRISCQRFSLSGYLCVLEGHINCLIDFVETVGVCIHNIVYTYEWLI